MEIIAINGEFKFKTQTEKSLFKVGMIAEYGNFGKYELTSIFKNKVFFRKIK